MHLCKHTYNADCTEIPRVIHIWEQGEAEGTA